MKKPTKPSLEHQIAETNAGFFLSEFSFSQNEIKRPNQTEVELADHVISIDDILIIFQLKERTEPTEDPDSELNWYRKKVLGKATSQIRDTIGYLETVPINIKNQMGHAVNLPNGISNYRVIKLIIYLPGGNLPEMTMREKGYESSSVGFIHLLRLRDYRGLLRSLVTLPEIIDYFEYRERICIAYPSETNILPEQALVGHYIRGDESIRPVESDANLLASLPHPETFDILDILQKFKEKTYATKARDGSPSQTEYYKILKELLHLNHNGLEAFKTRFMWAWKNCGAELKIPSRFSVPDRGCGFIFVPVPKGEEEHSETLLNNFTILAKYETRLDRCIGLAFRKDGEYRLIDWMHYEGVWIEDPELEHRLKSFPFRPLNAISKPRY